MSAHSLLCADIGLFVRIFCPDFVRCPHIILSSVIIVLFKLVIFSYTAFSYATLQEYLGSDRKVQNSDMNSGSEA